MYRRACAESEAFEATKPQYIQVFIRSRTLCACNHTSLKVWPRLHFGETMQIVNAKRLRFRKRAHTHTPQRSPAALHDAREIVGCVFILNACCCARIHRHYCGRSERSNSKPHCRRREHTHARYELHIQYHAHINTLVEHDTNNAIVVVVCRRRIVASRKCSDRMRLHNAFRNRHSVATIINSTAHSTVSSPHAGMCDIEGGSVEFGGSVEQNTHTHTKN